MTWTALGLNVLDGNYLMCVKSNSLWHTLHAPLHVCYPTFQFMLIHDVEHCCLSRMYAVAAVASAPHGWTTNV